MICTAARKWASKATKCTAMPNRVSTRLSAQCTGCRRTTTPTAPTSTISEAMTKTTSWITARALLPFLHLLALLGNGSDAERWPSATSCGGSGARSAVAEVRAPADHTDEVGVARWRRRPDPAAGVGVLALPPVLPRQPLRPAVVADEQLGLRVDRVVAIGEGELEQLRLGDRLGRARLDAQVAVDAAEVVDLVDESVALPRRRRVLGVVVGAAHVDALRRADPGAQLAADALLHPVLVPAEDMTAVQARRLLGLDVVGDVGSGQRLGERSCPRARCPSASRDDGSTIFLATRPPEYGAVTRLPPNSRCCRTVTPKPSK